MKPASHEPKPINIPDEIAARCEGSDQFQNFDRLVTGLLAVPKSVVFKDEKKRKRARARRNAKGPVAG